MMDLLMLASRPRVMTTPDNASAVNLVSLNEVDVLGLRRLGHATTVSGTRSLHARIASTTYVRSSIMLAELDYAVNAMRKSAPVAICAGRRLLDYASIAGNLCAVHTRTRITSAAGTACHC